MTFKARVLSALGVQSVLVVVGTVVLAQLNVSGSLSQLFALAVAAPVALYIAWAIVRERDELERENGG